MQGSATERGCLLWNVRIVVCDSTTIHTKCPSVKTGTESGR